MSERTQMTPGVVSQRPARVVDKKGLAVALTFLIAIAVWAGERVDKAIQLHTSWQKQPDLSAHIQIRKLSLHAETARHLIRSPRFASGERIHG
jgi:hypothetical protein